MEALWVLLEVMKKLTENFVNAFQNAQDKPVAMVWVLLILGLAATGIMAVRDDKKNKNPPK